jgi:predicted alpha/beta hydrolase
MPALIESTQTQAASSVLVPMTSTDGAHSELIVTQPRDCPRDVIYWLPALGVPAKHYVPLAEAFAAHGIAMALHEWRGIGSSDRRAGRQCDWGYRELLEADIPVGVAEVKTRWPKAKLWMGGHSLGGQFACLYASLDPRDVAGITLIASGAPFWRCFPRRALIRCAYSLASPLARLVGHLPGRRIGFGGNEARGLIADWAYSGLTGRYRAKGMDVDIERQLAELDVPLLALRLRDDWLVPQASLEWLLNKMPKAPRRVDVVPPERLASQRADHFSWMKRPDPLAAQLAEWISDVSVRPVDAIQA